jgi:putative transposase
MPQSLSAILVHVIFSTKNREVWIHDRIESELHAYATTVLTNAGCPTLAVNGAADHLHVLFNLSRTTTIADVVEALKTSTSKWIKAKGPEFRGFHWQTGYAAFSVSQSNVEQVVQYIQQQKDRHAARSFQDELRALLKKHGVAFDELYVWD